MSTSDEISDDAAIYERGRLAFWLRHERWSLRDAALILLDVDPDTGRYDEGDDDEDPRILAFMCFRDDFPSAWDDSPDEIRKLRRGLSDIRRIAMSAEPSAVEILRTPDEWTSWAVSKNVPVAWVAWARARHLIGQTEGDIADQQGESSLSQRERTSLLVIIAALARELKIDLGKPSKAADAIENLTVSIGARVASRTIEDYLKKVPDALERRGR